MFTLPGYAIPTGIPLGIVPPTKFSGAPDSGVLTGAVNSVFFSPALATASSVNRIDVAEVSLRTIMTDQYSRPEETDGRIFTFSRTGPARTNNALYRSQPTGYAVTAVMVQVIPPGPTTVVKIP